jgi:hypothetical protein
MPASVRRLLRILLTVATASSLVLFLLTVVLWVRSHRTMDRIWINVRPDRQPELSYGLACIQSGKGGCGFWYNRITFADYPDPGRNARAVYAGAQYGASDPQYPNEWSGVRPGAFHFVRTGQRPGQLPCFVGGVAASVPYWFVGLATFPGALLCGRRVLRRFRRGRDAKAGLCPACGYDLRATPERCPECGRPADRA